MQNHHCLFLDSVSIKLNNTGCVGLRLMMCNHFFDTLQHPFLDLLIPEDDGYFDLTGTRDGSLDLQRSVFPERARFQDVDGRRRKLSLGKRFHKDVV